MKKIWILLVVFLALAAFVYFYQIQGEQSRQEAKEREESIFVFDQADVVKLRIEYPERQPVAFEKGEDGVWRLLEPVQDEADDGAVDTLLRDVAEARTQRRLEKAEDLSPYGLANPQARIVVGLTEGESHELALGSEDFTHSKNYAASDRTGQVFLLPKSVLSDASKKLFDWRFKKAVSFTRSDVRNLRLRRPDAPDVVLERDGERWRIADPIQEAADKQAVNALFNAAEQARAQEFVQSADSDLSKYGLAPPQAALDFRESPEEAWQSLEIGIEKDGKRYAHGTSRSAVFTLDHELYDQLSQPLDTFRDRDLVSVSPDEVASLTLEKGDQMVEIQRQESKWMIVRPESHKDREVPSYRFWYPIESLRLESFADPSTPLDNPEIQIRWTCKDGNRETIAISCGKESTCRARRESDGRAGSIASKQVDALVFDAEKLAPAEGSS